MRRLLLAAFLVAVVVPAHAATRQVAIRNVAYNPATVTIAPGDTVTWTNHDQVVHTVTGDNDLTLRSESMDPDETYEHPFPTAGTFTYHCDRHQNMKGTVTVQAGGAGTTTSSSTTTSSTTTTRPPTTTTRPSTTTTAGGSTTTITTSTTAPGETTTTLALDDTTTSTSDESLAASSAGDDGDDDSDPSHAGPAAMAALLLAAVSGGAALAVKRGLL